MCGIIGQINFNKEPINEDLFNSMRDTFTYRGPDGAGTQLLNNNTLAFGHRRLSIIDLSDDGHQPMCNEDQSVWITFNGEIYNFKSLKKQLTTSGHIFKSKTDTEVLIHGYEEWGITGLLNRIKGMFAFVIWDQKKSKLVAARDRFGIKPFYYYQDDSMFIFASEIKAIVHHPKVKKRIDPTSLADYFIYSYVPNPATIWKDVRKLPPASYFEINCNKNALINVKNYWRLDTDQRTIPDKQAIEQANHLIHNAVKEHLVSDVPVGLFLSGGYDSSSVLMHMHDLNYEVNTFSIGFENSEKSEHTVARQIANIFGTKHHEQILTGGKNDFDVIEKLAHYYDDPYAISSMIPYYNVSKLASKSAKVAMVGDGGDEAFAGYKWHYHIYNYYKHFGIKRRIRHLLGQKQIVNVQMYNRWMTGVLDESLNSGLLTGDVKSNIRNRGLWLFEKHFNPKLSPVKSWQYMDVQTFIPEPSLTRADRSSMANSIEVRVPFLDHEIFEFTFSLDEKTYVRENVKKYLIYENLKDRIDQKILNLPKRGFSFQHLNKLFGDRFLDLTRNGMLVSQGIINADQIDKSTSLMKFHILVLELWFRNHY